MDIKVLLKTKSTRKKVGTTLIIIPFLFWLYAICEYNISVFIVALLFFSSLGVGFYILTED